MCIKTYKPGEEKASQGNILELTMDTEVSETCLLKSNVVLLF